MINFKFVRFALVVYVSYEVNVLVIDIILNITSQEHLIFTSLHIGSRLFELFSKEVRVKKQPGMPLRTVLVVYLSVPFLLKSSYTLLRLMLETVCIPPLTSLICEIKTRGMILWKYQVILVIEYIFIIKGINYAL